MSRDNVQRVIRSFASGAYRITMHAEVERETDMISIAELEEALGSSRLEQVEDYPDDPRGASGLFLGFTREGNPIHAVIGFSDPDIVIVVTLYRPEPELWYYWRRRVPS